MNDVSRKFVFHTDRAYGAATRLFDQENVEYTIGEPGERTLIVEDHDEFLFADALLYRNGVC